MRGRCLFWKEFLYLGVIMILILKVIVDFNDDGGNISNSKCGNDNEFDL